MKNPPNKFTVLQRKDRPSSMSVIPHGASYRLGENYQSIVVIEISAYRKAVDALDSILKVDLTSKDEIAYATLKELGELND